MIKERLETTPEDFMKDILPYTGFSPMQFESFLKDKMETKGPQYFIVGTTEYNIQYKEINRYMTREIVAPTAEAKVIAKEFKGALETFTKPKVKAKRKTTVNKK